MTEELWQNKGAVWVVAILGLVLFLATNLPWQLDDYDQAKQAYTSFEMVKEGHWLYQHTPHERIATKPPLVGWASAAIFAVTRSWAVAWRLPSVAAAIALSILLFRAGKVYGAIGGLFALSAFIFNLLTPRLATLVRTDMPLALAIFAIGLLIWNKLRLNEPWNNRDRWLLFGLLTAAMLIKGPIVYAFLLPGLLVAALYERRKSSAVADQRYIWSGWWPWVASLAIFLIWVIGGSLSVPGFYDQVVQREFLGRFGGTVHRPQQLFFYFPHLLHKFFPWSVLRIGLPIIQFRASKLDRTDRSSSGDQSRSAEGRGAQLDRTDRSSFKRLRAALAEIAPETLWLICWIFGGLIVMSIIPSKRVDRIFPVIPPLCLLLAAQLGHILPNESTRQRALRYSFAALLVSIAFTGAYSEFKVFTGYRDHRDALVKFGQAVREKSEQNHWRYAVVKSADEGLLLYLDKIHFIDLESAIAERERGDLDAIILPEKNLPDLTSQMPRNALPSVELQSRPQKDSTGTYVMIGPGLLIKLKTAK